MKLYDYLSMYNFYENDDEVVEEIEELYSFIPDLEKEIDEEEIEESLYEDLDDETGDIDF